MTTLDKNYPQGDPANKNCRGCGLRKVEHRGVRICPECDGPAMNQREVQA